MPLTATVLTDTGQLDTGLRTAWDDLAVHCGRPFCAPAWLEAWWSHAAPRGARLRIVVVREGPEVVGLAPCFATRSLAGGGERWGFLASDVSPGVEPLTPDGRADAVAPVLVRAMVPFRPARIAFDAVPARSRWPELLREHWPASRTPRICLRRTTPAMTIDLTGRDFDAWYMTKTSHFRKRLRKAGKLLAARGGGARLATPETVEADLRAFLRLHAARWEHREERSSITPAIGAMLLEAGRLLPVPDRLRVWTVEAGGDAIAAGVVVAAGEEINYWSSGFDERHREVSPARLAMLKVVEDAFGSGAHRLDLGAGDFDYKRSFSSQEDPLHWLWLIPPGPRHGLVRLQLRAHAGASAALSGLPPGLQATARSLRTRLGGG